MLSRISTFLHRLFPSHHAKDHFEKLPDEMCISIFNFLDDKSLTSAARINKRLSILVNKMPHYAKVKESLPSKRKILELKNEIVSLEKTRPSLFYTIIDQCGSLNIAIYYANVLYFGFANTQVIDYFRYDDSSTLLSKIVGALCAYAGASFAIGRCPPPILGYFTGAYLLSSPFYGASNLVNATLKTSSSFIVGSMVNFGWQIFISHIQAKGQEDQRISYQISELKDEINKIKDEGSHQMRPK